MLEGVVFTEDEKDFSNRMINNWVEFMTTGNINGWEDFRKTELGFSNYPNTEDDVRIFFEITEQREHRTHTILKSINNRKHYLSLIHLKYFSQKPLTENNDAAFEGRCPDKSR